MKWIGQHIVDFIARFRSDVYLEEIANPGSDTDKFLVADATTGKVGFRTGANVLTDIGASSESTDLEFNGSTANGVLTYGGAAQIDVESGFKFNSSYGLATINSSVNAILSLTNTHASNVPAINFQRTAVGDDGDDLGEIKWIGDDDGGEPLSTGFAKILGEIATAANGQEGGKLSLQVAAHDGGLENGLILEEGDIDAEVDVTIANGAASTTTIAGNMVVTTRLTASNQFSIGGHVVDDIDLAGEFVDSDNHLMTSAAIDDRIAAAGGGGADEVVSTGEHILKQTKVTFDQAACNNLHTGTVGSRTLVAAQGANKMIVPTEIVVFADRASTSTTGHDLVVAYNGSSAYATSVKYTRRFMHNVGTDRTKIMGPYAGTAANDLTTPVNSALTATFSASCTNNSLTSLTFYTSYYVIDIS